MLRRVAIAVLLSLAPQAARAACVCESALGASIPCGDMKDGDRFVCGLADTRTLQNKIVNLQLDLATSKAEALALGQKLKACAAVKDACPPQPPPAPESNVLLWSGIAAGAGLVVGVLLTVFASR